MPFGLPPDEYRELVAFAQRLGIDRAVIDARLRALARSDGGRPTAGRPTEVNEIPLADIDEELDEVLRRVLAQDDIDPDLLGPHADLL